MQIIKDKQLIANDWFFAEDDAVPSDGGNYTVSLECWRNRQPELSARPGRIGLRLNPADDVAALADGLDGIALIELNFPYFGDGRPFSQARLLRIRLGYQGEIRAVGQFLPDQVYYMQRIGFNAFQINDKTTAEEINQRFTEFTVNYQA